MWGSDSWGMGQSEEDIQQWEQICQKNLFLNDFAVTFVEKSW